MDVTAMENPPTVPEGMISDGRFIHYGTVQE